MYNPSRQRSLAELANEQLNGGRRRDKLAEGVAGAEKPDCLSPNAGTSLLGIPVVGLFKLPAIAVDAAQGKCK